MLQMAGVRSKIATFIAIYRANGISGVTNLELGVSYANVYRSYRLLLRFCIHGLIIFSELWDKEN
jgi:hypothetical protein